MNIIKNFRLGDALIVMKLVEEGADLNIRNAVGATPLHVAVMSGKHENAFNELGIATMSN